MKDKGGFTLIETVVALGILSMVLAGTLTLVINVMFLALNARCITVGNAYTQQRLADTVSELCTSCSTPNVTYTETKNIDGVDYTSTITIESDIDITPISGVSQGGGGSTVGEINGDDFYRVTSKVDWSYHGQIYDSSATQYVRRNQ